MFELIQQEIYGANIKVIGIGGGGCNAVETMIRAGLKGVEFIVCNTDKQALEASCANTKLQVGAQLTRGLGAGANPDVGRAAALEDRALIEEVVRGADMVFITAGMGGGTGTGGAPVIAEVAREAGALTVAVVTKPFNFEGRVRRKHAEEGLVSLKEHVDTLITIPNQRLLYIASEKTSILETFKKADDVLLGAVQGITDLINIRGLINLDFADVRTVMSNKGLALMGTGVASGEHRAMEAATKAISSPLLEDIAINGATGIIINITGGPGLTLFEVNEASTLITEEADENAEIIFGAVIDEAMDEEVRVTVIATGFKYHAEETAPAGLIRAPKSIAPVRPAMYPSMMNKPRPENVPIAPTPSIEKDLDTAVSSVNAPVVEENDVRDVRDTPAYMRKDDVKTLTPNAHENTLPEDDKHISFDPTLNRQESLPFDQSTPKQEENRQDVKSDPRGDMRTSENNKKGDNLEAARRLAKELGIKNLGDEEYDLPTFLRRPPGSDV